MVAAELDRWPAFVSSGTGSLACFFEMMNDGRKTSVKLLITVVDIDVAQYATLWYDADYAAVFSHHHHP